LTRYLDDGEVEIDNSAAERSLRGVALGRKNCLFLGLESGGERAPTMYSLLESAKLNGINAEACLRHVLSVIADYPINRIADLLPWHGQQVVTTFHPTALRACCSVQVSRLYWPGTYGKVCNTILRIAQRTRSGDGQTATVASY
jgi:hypothetical protein